MNIEQVANRIKSDIENAITNRMVNGSTVRKTTKKPFANGLEAKDSLIRSSTLINHLHEYIKHEFIRKGIDPSTIFPPLNYSKPELKVTGMYKSKNQDVCVKPFNIKAEKTEIDWGPMVDSGLYCDYGAKLTEQIISVNVRSQLSSLAKNADTLFERTFAETLNLHDYYPRMVMGEVYMIPVFEYDDVPMKENRVVFKKRQTNLEKYIRFFHYLNGRPNIDDEKHKYERCALVIIDFNQSNAKVYKSTAELVEDGLIKETFNLELADISPIGFVESLLKIHDERFSNKSIFL